MSKNERLLEGSKNLARNLGEFAEWCVDHKFWTMIILIFMFITSSLAIDYVKQSFQDYIFMHSNAVEIKNGIVTIDTRVFDEDLTIGELASALEVDVKHIRDLNPELNLLQNNAPLVANGVSTIKIPAPPTPLNYEDIKALVPTPTAWPDFTPTPAQGSTLEGIKSKNPDGTMTGEIYKIYVVKAGDNLFRIALNHGVTLQALLDANGIVENDLILPGESLVIPPPTK